MYLDFFPSQLDLIESVDSVFKRLLDTLPFQRYRIQFDLVGFDFLVSILNDQQLFDLRQHCAFSLEQEIANGKEKQEWSRVRMANCGVYGFPFRNPRSKTRNL
jgi:hypothetical protein